MAASCRGALPRPLEWVTTACGVSGRPRAAKSTFITALSMPTADASTPAPTYGTSASSSRPWTVPSSPKGPCSTGNTTSRPRPVTTAPSGSPPSASAAGRRSMVRSVSSLGCATSSVSRPARGRRAVDSAPARSPRRPRSRSAPVGEHPAAVLLDADRHGFVARAIEVLEDGGGRRHRHFVLARTAAVDDADAQFLHEVDNSNA